MIQCPGVLGLRRGCAVLARLQGSDVQAPASANSVATYGRLMLCRPAEMSGLAALRLP